MTYDLVLIDHHGNSLLFCQDLASVEEAREMWQKIAGIHSGQTLAGFEVFQNNPPVQAPVYKGGYFTDVCFVKADN